MERVPRLFGYCVVILPVKPTNSQNFSTDHYYFRDLAQLKEKIVECLDARGTPSLGVKFESAIVKSAATTDSTRVQSYRSRFID